MPFLSSRRLIAVVSLSLTIVAAAQTSVAPHLTPGYSFDLRVTGSNASGISGGPGTQNYTGHAVTTLHRGRVDIVSGGVDSIFGKGDYILFDSTDMVVVRPARQDFIALSRESTNRAMERMTAMGMQMTISDEKVTVDDLGAGDTVSGVPTRRYRMTIAFNMSMDAGVMQQRLGTESVTDYWVSSIPGIPNNPLLRSNGLAGQSMAGMFGPLAARVDSAAARMGHTITLRSVARRRVVVGPGQVIETQESSEVTDIRRSDVDERLLILPAGYKEAALPGVDAPPSSNASTAKWRALPSGRPR